MPEQNAWLAATLTSVDYYRRLIDASVEQLSDHEFFQRPRHGMSSVAIVLRHLGGNLCSRWKNFLIEDGEKHDRNRDSEFEDWPGSRASLIEFFDQGWNCLLTSLHSLTDEDLQKNVLIRGECLSVPVAIQRSVTHVSYHVGQLLYIARLIHNHDDNWHWLTIAPNKSEEYNAATWGRAAKPRQ